MEAYGNIIVIRRFTNMNIAAYAATSKYEYYTNKEDKVKWSICGQYGGAFWKKG